MGRERLGVIFGRVGGVMNDTLPETPSTPAAPETASLKDLPGARLRPIEDLKFSPTALQVLNSIGPVIGPLLRVALAVTPGGKPAWKTTEGWMAILLQLALLYGMYEHIVPPKWGTALCALFVVVFMILRILAKREALEQAANATITLAGGGVELIQGATPAAVPISSEANGVQGEPATGSGDVMPRETKPSEVDA